MKYYNANEDLEFVFADVETGTREHSHVSKYVTGLVLNGTVEVQENGRKWECQKDDFFLIPIEVVHALTWSKGKTRLLSMCVGEKFLSKYDYQEGIEEIRKIIGELLEQKTIDSNQAEAFEGALQLIYELYFQRENQKVIQQDKTLPNDNLLEVKQMVMESPEQDFNLDDLAKQVYISKYYLIRKFKQEVGLTPHNFQLQNRIRKAQKLLREGWTISDTAVEMGFFDQSHFIKTFKGIVGISPREYVESVQFLQ